MPNRTHPLPEESFCVNLLGRGYPAPNRTFRWCTDRTKIRPTSRFIREQVSHADEAILLLGVRSSESATRSNSGTRHAAKAVDILDSMVSAEVHAETSKFFADGGTPENQLTIEDRAGIPTGLARDIAKQVEARRAKRPPPPDNLA